MNENSFAGVRVRDVLLLVPEVSGADYQNHEVWGLFWAETPTAISTSLAETSDEAVYNLSGQRISAKQKGVNIVGGKKILVK